MAMAATAKQSFTVTIGKDIEIGAADLLKWVTKGATTAAKVTPGALAAFGVLANQVEKVLSDAASGAANPASLVIALPSDIADFQAGWTDLKNFFATLGAKI